MRYLGGKTKLASYIAGLINTSKGNRSSYIEPFIGGGSVFAAVAPGFARPMAGDICQDIAELWIAAAAGWVPPIHVTEQDYQSAKLLPPGALRGFVGFGCSFGGLWFQSMAKDPYGIRNYPAESSRSVTKLASKMSGALIRHCSYIDWDGMVTADSVVYCDPPYAGTTGYVNTPRFDHEQFWSTMEAWSGRGALVLVSEYAAPQGWDVALEKQHRKHLSGAKSRSVSTEKVFIHA